MQMRQWRRWAAVLALTVLGLTTLRPLGARADGSPQPPGEHEHVRKIGPQAVVIVDDQGRARMYDDPSQQAPACKTTAACWGQALGSLATSGAGAHVFARAHPDDASSITAAIPHARMLFVIAITHAPDAGSHASGGPRAGGYKTSPHRRG
jgi:hypothetical protein